MAKITNKHTGPLTVHGVTIAPGKTAEIENFDAIYPVKRNDAGQVVGEGSTVIEQWIKAGAIVVESADAGEGVKAAEDEKKGKKAKGATGDAGEGGTGATAATDGLPALPIQN